PKPASRSSPAPPATWASRSSTSTEPTQSRFGVLGGGKRDHLRVRINDTSRSAHGPPNAPHRFTLVNRSPRYSIRTFAPQGVTMPKKHSKRYKNAIKVADLTQDYPLKDAVEILTKFPKAKFDETVELSFRLGVDATSGDQNVRGTTPLPNGSGKKVRVIVFTDDPQAALAAGADEAGLADLM